MKRRGQRLHQQHGPVFLTIRESSGQLPVRTQSVGGSAVEWSAGSNSGRNRLQIPHFLRFQNYKDYHNGTPVPFSSVAFDSYSGNIALGDRHGRVLVLDASSTNKRACHYRRFDAYKAAVAAQPSLRGNAGSEMQGDARLPVRALCFSEPFVASPHRTDSYHHQKRRNGEPPADVTSLASGRETSPRQGTPGAQYLCVAVGPLILCSDQGGCPWCSPVEERSRSLTPAVVESLLRMTVIRRYIGAFWSTHTTTWPRVASVWTGSANFAGLDWSRRAVCGKLSGLISVVCFQLNHHLAACIPVACSRWSSFLALRGEKGFELIWQ